MVLSIEFRYAEAQKNKRKRSAELKFFCEKQLTRASRHNYQHIASSTKSFFSL